MTGNPAAAVAAGASEFTMSVSTGAACAWTASSSASFITPAGATSVTGPGSVKFNVVANTGAARQGSVTVAGQAFQISQQAASPGCSYSVSPASTSAPQAGGDVTFGVTAAADCAWTTTVTDTFITIKQGATGTGNGTVVLTITANSGSSRNGGATIAGTAVTIAQDGPPNPGPSTHAVVLSLQPDPGELITQGQPYTFTAFAPQQAGVEADVSSPGVRVDGRGTDGHNWTLRMANTSPQRPAAGLYNNAIKAGTFPTGYPMLDFTLDGQKCSTLTGRFLVAQATYGTNNTVIRFHAKFEMFCDGASMRLVGEIWVDAAGSTVVPAMGSLPAPGPPNSFFTFQSPPGEPAGLGQSKTFTLANARLHAAQAFGPGIVVNASPLPGAPSFSYSLVLVAPSGQLLTPGTYNNARLYPNQPPPGFYFYNSAAAGTNPICTTATGKFVVLEAVWGPNSEVFRFRATFEYSCNGFMPPLTGEVYIVADPWR